MADKHNLEDHPNYVTPAVVTDPVDLQWTRHSVDDLLEAPDVDDVNEEEEELADRSDPAYAEQSPLWMPSSLTLEQGKAVGIGYLQEIELNLCQGQANTCLHKLQMALGQKLALYKLGVREAATTEKELKAHSDIHNLTTKIYAIVRSYSRARTALERLQASPDIMKNYLLIGKEHLSLSEDLTDENRYGQGKTTIPWFWRTKLTEKQGEVKDSRSMTWQDESLYLLLFQDVDCTNG